MITLDFETYSDAGYRFDGVNYKPLVPGKPGLFSINASTYAAHPSTDIICMAYDVGGVDYLWIPGANPPTNLFNAIAAGEAVEAHNSLFEFYVWNCVGVARYGWPALRLEQMFCSMSKARAFGLPGALAKVSEILSPNQLKDPRGKKLIQMLSIPKRPTKLDQSTRRTPEVHK